MSTMPGTAPANTAPGTAAPVRVTVALDGTPHSATLVCALSHYITPLHAKIHLMTVLPDSPDKDTRFASLDAEVQEENARRISTAFDQYEDALADQQMTLAQRDVVTDANTAERGILDLLSEHPTDLLVLGMNEQPRLKNRPPLRTTSYNVATHAQTPVMVIKRPPLTQGKLRVLVATDGSKSAQDAVIRLTKFLPVAGTELMVLTVVSLNTYALPLVEPFIDYAPLEAALTGQATTLLEQTKGTLTQAGYTVTADTFTLGDPVPEILEMAKRESVDLIVVGSHGHGTGVRDWLLGSVSSRILELSDASVAILH